MMGISITGLGFTKKAVFAILRSNLAKALILVLLYPVFFFISQDTLSCHFSHSLSLYYFKNKVDTIVPTLFLLPQNCSRVIFAF